MDAQPSDPPKRAARGVARWLDCALALVFPRNCPLCNRTLAERDQGCVCPYCLTAFRRIHPPMCQACGRPVDGDVSAPFVCSHCMGKRVHYDRALSACLADPRMLDAIHRFKYQREIYFGPTLGKLLVEGAARYVAWAEVDAIVPVPLHPRKERWRQFNQARVLSEALRGAFGKSLIDGNLRRVLDTPSQTFLNADERRKNLREAFRIRNPEEFHGKRLVLVDDVFTTGSTSNICALELKKAGAKSVLALTLARAY